MQLPLAQRELALPSSEDSDSRRQNNTGSRPGGCTFWVEMPPRASNASFHKTFALGKGARCAQAVLDRRSLAKKTSDYKVTIVSKIFCSGL